MKNLKTMADIKKSYPNAWMFVGKTNYKPYNLISEFSKEIKVFEKIYEPSYFEKLKNNYTISLIYSPIALTSINITRYDYTEFTTLTRTVTHTEFETLVDNYGNEISEENRTNINSWDEEEEYTESEKATNHCNLIRWGSYDSYYTNTNLSNIKVDPYSPHEHQNLLTRQKIDFANSKKWAIDELPKYIENQTIHTDVRNIIYSIKSQEIYFIPIYVLTTFDGANSYYMNAYTGEVFSILYNEQKKYIRKDISENRTKIHLLAKEKILKNIKKTRPFTIFLLMCVVAVLTFTFLNILSGNFNILYYKQTDNLDYNEDVEQISTYFIWGILALWLIISFVKVLLLKRNMLGCIEKIRNSFNPNEQLSNSCFKEAKKYSTARICSFIFLLIICLAYCFTLLNMRNRFNEMLVRECSYVVNYEDYSITNFKGKYISLDVSQIDKKIDNPLIDENCHKLTIKGNTNSIQFKLSTPKKMKEIVFDSISLNELNLEINNNVSIIFNNCAIQTCHISINDITEKLAIISNDLLSIQIKSFNFVERKNNFELQLTNITLNGKINYLYENTTFTITSSGIKNSITSDSTTIKISGHLHFNVIAPLTIDSNQNNSGNKLTTVICKNITKNGEELLTIRGCDGKDGKDGVSYAGVTSASGNNGENAWVVVGYGTGTDGEAGKKGTNGGNGGDGEVGGAALEITDLTITSINLSNINLSSGNCGNGGNGGDGGNGGRGGNGGICVDNWLYGHVSGGSGGNGGDGGNGGNGGNAYEALNPCNVTITGENIVLTKGKNGTPGNNGLGGLGALGGTKGECTLSTHLTNGTDGKNGIDGTPGKLLLK